MAYFFTLLTAASGGFFFSIFQAILLRTRGKEDPGPHAKACSQNLGDNKQE